MQKYVKIRLKLLKTVYDSNANIVQSSFHLKRDHTYIRLLYHDLLIALIEIEQNTDGLFTERHKCLNSGQHILNLLNKMKSKFETIKTNIEDHRQSMTTEMYQQLNYIM